uniref:Variant surface glycoprotein 647 n=1 Tax=Trypanosoma brucei TaxID=5691 RepID=M4SXK7_9TRYP|nr:variant surface glycoprotein 647 [Trypanosoma brucei]
MQALFFIALQLATILTARGTKHALSSKGFDDACGLSKELKKLARFPVTAAKNLEARLQKLRGIDRNIQLLLLQQKIATEEDNLNDAMYVQYQIREIQQTLQGKLPQAIKQGTVAALAAGRIDETTYLFAKANTGDGNAYCISNQAVGTGPATKNQIPKCHNGNELDGTIGDEEQDTYPDLAPARAALTENSAAKGPTDSKNCALSSTQNTNGIIHHASNNPTLLLAGGLLKIDESDTAANPWQKATDTVGAGMPLTELHELLATDTKELATVLAKSDKTAKLGTEEKAGISDITLQSTNVGLKGETREITIRADAFDRISKAIKNFLDGDQTQKDKERQTLARDILVKALAKPPEPPKCDTPATENACNEIKIEADCNKTAACSFNKTEADENKKCKFDAKKATSKDVPVTETQTVGGTGATTGNCKDKKKDDCKSPDCKWEGETCKDSSIIVTNQFALSMVSAAFVALLF